MNAEFNWWLLIVGLVIGGGLVWLVLLDARRRDDEISAQERVVEAAWLSDVLAEEGTPLSPALVERVLQLHADYLLATSVPPPSTPPETGPNEDLVVARATPETEVELAAAKDTEPTDVAGAPPAPRP